MRVEKVVTSGAFVLDGGSWEVDNNVWLIGDDEQVVVIDAAHDPEAILAAVGERDLVAILCTHGHNDHINAAVQVARRADAMIGLHPYDGMLWDALYSAEYPDVQPDFDLVDGGAFSISDVELVALHTPGHSPGAVCFYAPQLKMLFSGDTLFEGGPGATGRSYSDFDTIMKSIESRLLKLPADTVVHTGHGNDTTIGAESPHVEEWRARGH